MLKKILNLVLEYENYLVILTYSYFPDCFDKSYSWDTGYWTQFWRMFPVAVIIATFANMVGISGAALFVPFFAIVFPALAFGLTPGQSVMASISKSRVKCIFRLSKSSA